MPSLRVLAVGNLKGGTGKTTAAVNVAAALARQGRRTLLLDFDPQGSASVWFRDADTGAGMVEAIRSRDLSPILVPISDGLDLAPSGAALAVGGAALLSGEPVPTVLAETIAGSSLPHEYVVIDCPPSAGPLVYNALAAASGVLVPCEPSQLALLGLAQFEALVRQLARVTPALRIVGVEPSKVSRTAHARQVMEVLAERYGELLLPAIPEAVALRDAAAWRVSIFDHEPGHKAALAFEETAREIQARMK